MVSTKRSLTDHSSNPKGYHTEETLCDTPFLFCSILVRKIWKKYFYSKKGKILKIFSLHRVW